jgi:VanZ family protein
MTKYWLYAAVAYVFFVVYGSLVPLAYHNIPWQQAVTQFKNIRYLDLGIESRADWIANIVLYIPLAFLGLAVLGNTSSTFRWLGAGLVLCACIALAVGIEFCQLFFPPRTVSINDLIAESLGTVVGICLYQRWGQRILSLCNRLSVGELLSVTTLIKVYLLCYLALSFFPYDFVTSFTELEDKLANSQNHFFIALDACTTDGIRCALKFSVEVLVLLPLGGLFFLLPHIAHKRALAVLVGFFLGVFCEVVQLFLFSGIAQGFSVITRMLGLGLGVVIAEYLYLQSFSETKKWLKPIILACIVPYLILVFIINGGWAGQWLTLDSMSSKLAETRFLPFYYFYYTTETIALVSLISNVGLYMPIGIALCLWEKACAKNRTSSWFFVGSLSACLAVMVETEKLFLAEKHPDPTDIWIAFSAASVSYVLTHKALHWFQQEKRH